ncbi:Actin-like protein arp8 [Cryptotrichosporon argae]
MDASPPPSQVTAVNAGNVTPVAAPAPSAVAGPSSTPATVPRKSYPRKPKPKAENLLAYTTAFVPGLYNMKNPAGDYVQKESNLEVARQVSQARAQAERAAAEAARAEAMNGGSANGASSAAPENPLSRILIVHPGSRNLRIGRASDFYPHEVPNCIARPRKAGGVRDAVVPGSRAKRPAQTERNGAAKKRNGYAESSDEDEWVDPVDAKIGYLRDYLRNRLRQERLATDYKEGARVNSANAKAKPENLPEHNDPYRIDWTEPNNRPFIIGTEALRLPESARYQLRWPIMRRGFNTRDWKTSQLLIDDIATILEETMRTELQITPRDYSKFSVVLIVPDHGDRFYVQELTRLLLGTMGFKEIAVHQESHCAIFSAGMSTACVVDIGAQTTSVTCVDEGLVNADTRMTLAYGGDDVTSALVTLLQRCSFPYRDLDLARAQEWLMMDNLKIKICTLEEHMVANTPWDFHVLRTEGLTQKYALRTYDENILAPLCLFDTRMIDSEEKNGDGQIKLWDSAGNVDDMLSTGYDEVTGAMRAWTSPPVPVVDTTQAVEPAEAAAEPPEPAEAEVESASVTPAPKARSPPAPASMPAEATVADSEPANASRSPLPTTRAGLLSPLLATHPLPPTPPLDAAPLDPAAEEDMKRQATVDDAARAPLDGAIASAISVVGTENKVRAAANGILLIGGGSTLKGLGPFIADRLPGLLRAKGLAIHDVQIVPPPRGVNPRYVSWKGASVMCNLDGLADMWIRRDEWQAVGARALKDRCLFL